MPTREAVPERLAAYVDQAGVAGEDRGIVFEGEIPELGDDDTEIAKRLADTRALTVLTTAGRGEESVQLSLMATSDAVFAMETPEDATERTEIHEVARETLIELIAAAMPEVAEP